MIGQLFFAEGKRPWWVGRASNPVGGAMRRRVGSTPIPLRHHEEAPPPRFARPPQGGDACGLAEPVPRRLWWWGVRAGKAFDHGSFRA
jgi:hypothetical protein